MRIFAIWMVNGREPVYLISQVALDIYIFFRVRASMPELLYNFFIM
jgi:hypothetical protein